ncbi:MULTISPECIES: efflux RND transporter permease subunit [unclassified Pseudomonas]|uniref:efflux RND transporter permease subunit n=1 Tax=unclassified Pseudomonas TaxID=196821 RepID=UPI00249BBC2C|nr:MULTISPECIES: efflux RND transporter permease subunit [unclassified Pseudomonas]MDI3251120.1 efflux RND transporter permease subunit [Pseudomonas sp. AL10]MDI3267223.1 efflux RND transporter permease subunit [Pseudomonas sp. AL15]
MLIRVINILESWLFGHRALVISLFALATLVAGYFAVELRMEAGFEKQLPQDHEYIKTFNEFRDQLFGANRVTVVLHSRHGDIWNENGLRRLLDVTEAISALPGVNRSSVTSLWTPNVFFTQVTENGFEAQPVTGGDVAPNGLTDEVIAQIRDRATRGGHIGTLVSNDQTSGAVTADLFDQEPGSGQKLDYIVFNKLLEGEIRTKFENDDYEVQIIGFAKQIGAIADEGRASTPFFILAFVLTALAVFWYCHSIKLTVLPLFCSLISLVWQLGALHLLGYGLDPLAVLVPFLVFAIGVSHGVQQINFIVRELAAGNTAMGAARASFTGLLIPGTLALVTALVSFITLLMIPIPMIHELAITASIGVLFKILTNLVLLPVAASFINVPAEYARRAMFHRERRSGWLTGLSRLAEPQYARWVVMIGVAVFCLAYWQSLGRHIGSLERGAPELRADSRFNQDALSIASSFNVGLDWLTVVLVAPANSCDSQGLLQLADDMGWAIFQAPGVVAVESAATLGKEYSAALNEANPKMLSLPRDSRALGGAINNLQKLQGVRARDCSVIAVNFYLQDHKATTIQEVVERVEAFRTNNIVAGVEIRLASGNAGVQAAINEVVEKSEAPMLLYVYGTILLLVFLTYRDWRAMLVCCVPLTVATWVGYWFMKDLDIGLTVATLPVMVLAVGVGVDYAFYIYNRLQLHLSKGMTTTQAAKHALLETGVATIFTAITLSIGVATWSFSQLKFQADMGKLLAFMFMINMVMAMTLLPAVAVMLDKWIPRRRPVRALGIAAH